MINDQYFIDEAENGLGNCLVLKSSWTDEFWDIIQKENISILRISESAGWRGNNIDFLNSIDERVKLRGIELYAWDIKDITPIWSLPDIEYLGLQCSFTKAFNFSLLESLRFFKAYWRPKAKTVLECKKLQLLNIVNYPFSDFSDLNQMVHLERLQISSRKLVSLSGIENLKSLKVLDLFDCRSLEDISDLRKCEALRAVEIDSCKNIEDRSVLYELGFGSEE